MAELLVFHLYLIMFCPDEISDMSLHQWISRCEDEKKPTGKKLSKQHVSILDQDAGGDDEDGDNLNVDVDSDSDSEPTKHSLLSFQDGHPLTDSHGTHCQAPMKAHVPNFIGATLPCFDYGDHEYYCSAMLTLEVWSRLEK